MQPPVGHDLVRRSLQDHLPAASLFLGPSSVGKLLMARYVLWYHGIHDPDVRVSAQFQQSDMYAVRQFCSVAPFGQKKGVALKLPRSYRRSEFLLALLETPPPWLRIILVASWPVPAALRSRTQVYSFGLLSDRDVTDVLVLQGIKRVVASNLAAISRGHVRPAMEAAEQASERAMVASLLKSVSDHDLKLFDRVSSVWNDAAHRLFILWMAEAATNQWRYWREDESFGIQPKTVKAMANVVRLNISSKLALVSVLRPLVSSLSRKY